MWLWTPWRHAGQHSYISTHSDLGIRYRISASCSGPLLPWQVLGAHRIGGWVCPKTEMENLEKKNIPRFWWESKDSSIVQPVTSLLQWLSYPVSHQQRKIKFYGTKEFLPVEKNVVLSLKYVRSEDLHHHKKWERKFLSIVRTLPLDFTASYPKRQSILTKQNV